MAACRRCPACWRSPLVVLFEPDTGMVPGLYVSLFLSLFLKVISRDADARSYLPRPD